jgi:hypothetical protein
MIKQGENKMTLSMCERIYYTGDMANQEGFGMIVERKESDLRIKWDDAERSDSWVSEYCFSETYSGNGSTRFVTAKAYHVWRKTQLEKFAALASSVK